MLSIKDRNLYDRFIKIDPITNDDLFYLDDNDIIDISLDSKGYIYFSKIVLKENGKKLLDEYKKLVKSDNIAGQDNNFQQFLDSWYDLWPKGIKSGGYYVKTDKNGCGKNLQKFIKNNPNISKETILKATEKYLMDMKDRNYSMCKLAPYFVYKDNLSLLEGYCSNLNETSLDGEFDPFTVKV